MTAKKKKTPELSTEEKAELSTEVKAELSTDTPEDKAPEDKAPEDKAPELSTEDKAELYTVAEGVSITSKRGTLSEKVAIEARDLSGGQASLDALLKSKKIVKA